MGNVFLYLVFYNNKCVFVTCSFIRLLGTEAFTIFQFTHCSGITPTVAIRRACRWVNTHTGRIRGFHLPPIYRATAVVRCTLRVVNMRRIASSVRYSLNIVRFLVVRRDCVPTTEFNSTFHAFLDPFLACRLGDCFIL